MRILLINSALYPRGGDWTYVDHINCLLRENGQETSFFGPNHPNNVTDTSSEYLVNQIDFREAQNKISPFTAVQVALNSVYSFEAKTKLATLIKTVNPDVAHLNNIHHHLSLSIIHTLHKHEVPVVWTLHDYTLICPVATFLSNGKVCEHCLDGKFYHCVFQRCKYGKVLPSVLASIEAYVQRFLGIQHLVDKFISPSAFLRSKFIEFGFDPSRIINISNPINTKNVTSSNIDKGYILYIGRISEEKGVSSLISAMKSIPHVPLHIAGDGPQKTSLEEQCQKEKISNVTFLGSQSGMTLANTIMGSRFLVVPSKWYENYPYSILESFLHGKAVIASNIGGLPELVNDNITGRLVPHDDVAKWSAEIDWLFSKPELCIELGNNARKKVINECSYEVYYPKLHNVYNEVLSPK